ncbi:MAG: SDR family NAD(P)-dependent oxidoreductase [Hyphomonadaceae bacterium]
MALQAKQNDGPSGFAQKDDCGLILAASEGGWETYWNVLEQARSFYQAGGKRLVFVCPATGWAGGVPGLARTAAREWPNMLIQTIGVSGDVEESAAMLSSIADAIHSGAPHINLSGPDTPQQPKLGEALSHSVMSAHQNGGVWLVTGGARGVTADCAIELARRTGGKFALLGRSVPVSWPDGVAPDLDLNALRGVLAKHGVNGSARKSLKEINALSKSIIGGREIRQTLAAIRDAGGQANYYPCDLTQAKTVRGVVSQIESDLGAISGVVHGAGILADRMIVDKTQEELARVFATKVSGLQNVLDAVDLTHLTHIGLFSSAAAFFGNAGQADYAMANEVLNSVARELYLSEPNRQIKSFNWGPWDGGMVDETLARHFAAQGIGLIPRAAGARIFADQMLNGDKQNTELVIGDEWTH